MEKRLTILVGILIIVALGGIVWNFWGEKIFFQPPATETPIEKTVITFAEGALTSPCYPITSAMVEVWNNYLPDIAATSELAPGRLVDNLKAVEEGKYNFRWAMGSLAFYSYNGVKMEELKDKPMESLRTIGAFWNHEVHIVAKADSPINDISELKGKEVKVAVAEEKKWIVITAKEILGIYGIPNDKIEIILVPLAEIAQSVKAGDTDIGIFACSVECKQALILKKTTGIKFLSLSQDVIQKLEEKYTYYVTSLIPKNTYPAQSEDVRGVAIKGTIICSKDIDSDLVYRLTKTIFSHLDEIKGATPVAKDMSLEGAVEGIAIPFHPGAERYYSEIGLISK
jgi:TRAP transporter TAXI family solute receptor